MTFTHLLTRPPAFFYLRLMVVYSCITSLTVVTACLQKTIPWAGYYPPVIPCHTAG